MILFDVLGVAVVVRVALGVGVLVGASCQFGAPLSGNNGVMVPLICGVFRPAGIVGNVGVALGVMVYTGVSVSAGNVGVTNVGRGSVWVGVMVFVLVHVAVLVSVSVGGTFVCVGESVRVGMCVAGAFVAVTVGAVVGGASGYGLRIGPHWVKIRKPATAKKASDR